MTAWTEILNAAVAVGGIPSSSTVTALRDNVKAAAESSSGAPVVAAGWHPWDKVTIGDGKTGLVYSFGVSGLVSAVETPDFVDGYEYRLVIDDISHNSGSSRSLVISLYDETDASYKTVYTATAISGGAGISMDIEIPLPRLAKEYQFIRFCGVSAGTVITDTVGVYNSSDHKTLKAKIEWNIGSIDRGNIYLFRRREYASSP
jgi:hypothetical protein